MPVLPVVHHLTDDLALEQCDVAFAAGADGVFLISHHGRDRAIARLASRVAADRGRGAVGVNFLSMGFEDAYDAAVEAGAGMLWVDAPGIRADGTGPEASRISLDAAMRGSGGPTVFASVAFKYQPAEPDPGAAAVRARALGFLPVTSGRATGSAPTTAKLASMRRALGDAPLAVASGMTPTNVGEFLPYVTHFMVATGVSVDEHRFDPRLLRSFVDAARPGQAAA